MARRLKTSVFLDLTSTVFRAVPSPAVSTRHARGVRYLEPIVAIKIYYGIMNSLKKGRKYRKHIIVRRAPRFKGLHQLYTYHFPKTWSAACVANRELIKEAQRQAHALEHDYSHAAIEWRIRFFKHYFLVYKGHQQPEPGLKPYSRFYQYVYVAIYRQLQAARDAAQQAALELPPTADDVTFDPIKINVCSLQADIIRRSFHASHNSLLSPLTISHSSHSPSSPPLWQEFCKILT